MTSDALSILAVAELLVKELLQLVIFEKWPSFESFMSVLYTELKKLRTMASC